MAVLQLGALRGGLVPPPQDFVQLGLQVRLLLGEPLRATGCGRSAGEALRLTRRPFHAAAMGTCHRQARPPLEGGGTAAHLQCDRETPVFLGELSVGLCLQVFRREAL